MIFYKDNYELHPTQEETNNKIVDFINGSI